MAPRAPSRRRPPSLLLAVVLSLAPIFVAIWLGWTLVVAVLLAHRAVFVLAVLMPASARRLTLRPLAPMTPPEWATDGVALAAARRDVASASVMMMPLPDAQVFALGTQKDLEIYVSHGALAALDDQERSAIIERVLVGAAHREPGRRARALVASRGLRALVLPVLPGGVALVRVLDQLLVVNRSLWQAGVLPRTQETDLDQLAVREGVDARSLASALRVCASTLGAPTSSMQVTSIDIIALARSPRIESDGMAFRRLGRALVLERAARLDALAGNRRHRHLSLAHDLPPLPTPAEETVEVVDEAAEEETVVVAEEPTGERLLSPVEEGPSGGSAVIDATELLGEDAPRRGIFGRRSRRAKEADDSDAGDGAQGVMDHASGVGEDTWDVDHVVRLPDDAPGLDAAPMPMDDDAPGWDAPSSSNQKRVDHPRTRRRFGRRRARGDEHEFPPLQGDPRTLPPPSGPPLDIDAADVAGGDGSISAVLADDPSDIAPGVVAKGADDRSPAMDRADAWAPEEPRGHGEEEGALRVTEFDADALVGDASERPRRWWRRGRRRDADAVHAEGDAVDIARVRAEIDEVFLPVSIPEPDEAIDDDGDGPAHSSALSLDGPDADESSGLPSEAEPVPPPRDVEATSSAALPAPPVAAPEDDVFARHIRTPLDDLAEEDVAHGDDSADESEAAALPQPVVPVPAVPSPRRSLLARLFGSRTRPPDDEGRPEIPLGVGLPPPVPVVVDPEAAQSAGVIDAPSAPILSDGAQAPSVGHMSATVAKGMSDEEEEPASPSGPVSFVSAVDIQAPAGPSEDGRDASHQDGTSPGDANAPSHEHSPPRAHTEEALEPATPRPSFATASPSADGAPSREDLPPSVADASLPAEEHLPVDEAPLVDTPPLVGTPPLVAEAPLVDEASVADAPPLVSEAPLVAEPPLVDDAQLRHDAPLVGAQLAATPVPVPPSDPLADPLVGHHADPPPVITLPPVADTPPAMDLPPVVDPRPAVEEPPPMIDAEAPPVIDPLPVSGGPRRIRYAQPVVPPVSQPAGNEGQADEEFVAAFRDPLGERLRGLRRKSRRR